MVDFITYLTANFYEFFNLGSSIFFVVICVLLHNKTGNKGFISIIVGSIVSIGWTSIKLFLLEGVYFVPNMHDSGMSNVDISLVLMMLGGVNLVISAIGLLTLLIGLWIITNELPKKSYNTIH